ncbi:MAG: DGQHR domain-containing protein [Candidatus Margulisbacteria bacterium]|nr:DGQHR domain-containing protein [Candidatus Margulisiibacteriota bacterium]
MLTDEQKQEKREKASFKRKIISVFKNTGFQYLNTENVNVKFGLKKGELDYVFLFENIILVCEDTITREQKHIKTHLRNKTIFFQEIVNDKSSLIKFLKERFNDKFGEFHIYNDSRYQIFFLYFTKNKLNLSSDEIQLYQPCRIVQLASLNYFVKMAQNIKYSARNEIFRFLDVSSKHLGISNSAATERNIETTIIYPADNTGLRNGVRIVSFMMSAEILLRNCFVLRKDNWEDSIQLYQRLIEKPRIQRIREYLAEHKTTFFNNIIVSLPKGISFKDKEKGEVINIDNIHTFENFKMCIPDEINSICVIDGQHRIFAHYQGDDIHEKVICKLRDKLHLLVTGLIFPEGMRSLERRKYESEIFLDINSNAKPVPPDVLLHIETLKDPFSNIGIARQVLDELNNKQLFLNFFQLSLMEKSKIKIASIIKFALKYLVDILKYPDDEYSLFNYWNEKEKDTLLKQQNEKLLKEYVVFISTTLEAYFSALKATFQNDWLDNESKILSTTSINGFIIALRRSLPKYNIKGFDFYKQCFDKLKINFSKQNFPYTSSQYAKFSKQILEQCFDLITDESEKLN